MVTMFDRLNALAIRTTTIRGQNINDHLTHGHFNVQSDCALFSNLDSKRQSPRRKVDANRGARTGYGERRCRDVRSNPSA